MSTVQQLICRETSSSYGDMFNQHISDLVLEVESIKGYAARNNMEQVLEHAVQINSILLEIMDIKLEVAENGL